MTASRSLTSAGILALWAVAAPLSTAQSIQPRMGEPLEGLGAAEQARFLAGRDEFGRTLVGDEGLGPTFNDSSCSTCHARPRPGGFGSKRVTRFGKAAIDGTPFDPLASLGGSLLQSQTLSPKCQEVVPREADVTAHRLTTPVFGAGLVEAIPDADIAVRATSPPAGVSGRVHLVVPFEAPLLPRVGRFGWKAQVATLLTFSADASLNEMGLTNRFLGAENAPNGDESALALCDTVADPEDGPDSDGLDRIDRQTDFQRFLAAPPQTPRTGMRGEATFAAIGCAHCHVTAPYATGPGPEPALAGRTLKPYSDFLLHDVGALGDGIVQGDAAETELRTPPLWGLRARAVDELLHDGRATGGTPAENLYIAIAAHGGEAAASAARFESLKLSSRRDLVDFLLSLGRAEFDYEGDNDVDSLDWTLLRLDGRFTGPGVFFTADDPGAIADFDADGDFDLVDVATMQRAATGDLLGGERERQARAERAENAAAAGRSLFQREWGAARVDGPRTGPDRR
jgi:Di-haem oxidoreductase, putative peroxidase